MCDVWVFWLDILELADNLSERLLGLEIELLLDQLSDALDDSIGNLITTFHEHTALQNSVEDNINRALLRGRRVNGLFLNFFINQG